MTRLAQPRLSPEEQLRVALHYLGEAFVNNDLGMPKKIVVSFEALQKIKALSRQHASFDVNLSMDQITGDIEFKFLGIHFDTK